MDEKKKPMNGFQLRLVLAALLFLSFTALSQTGPGQKFIEYAGIVEKIQSNEDIYKVEDACIVWYNSVTKDKQ